MERNGRDWNYWTGVEMKGLEWIRNERRGGDRI